MPSYNEFQMVDDPENSGEKKVQIDLRDPMDVLLQELKVTAHTLEEGNATIARLNELLYDILESKWIKESRDNRRVWELCCILADKYRYELNLRINLQKHNDGIIAEFNQIKAEVYGTPKPSSIKGF